MSRPARAESTSAQIIPFPLHRCRQPRFSPRDRMELIRWLDEAGDGARLRAEVHDDARESAECGDFLLIYRQGRAWAEWAVARGVSHYSVWRPSSGQALGDFASMRAALEAILAQGG